MVPSPYGLVGEEVTTRRGNLRKREKPSLKTCQRLLRKQCVPWGQCPKYKGKSLLHRTVTVICGPLPIRGRCNGLFLCPKFNGTADLKRNLVSAEISVSSNR